MTRWWQCGGRRAPPAKREQSGDEHDQERQQASDDEVGRTLAPNSREVDGATGRRWRGRGHRVLRASYSSGMNLPPLFAGLDPAVARETLAGARRRSFGRGDIVFHEGDPGDSMLVVTRGHFACRLTTREGQDCMFRIYSPGDTLGRLAVAPLDAVRSLTIVSLEESEALEIFRAQLDELRAANPIINDALLGLAGLEMRRLAELLVEARFVDADRRVRRRLLELGEHYRDHETGLTVIPLTHEEIGQLAGASRVTVSRVLAQEERMGTLLKQRRTIALLDPDGLARSAGWPEGATPPGLRRT